MTLATGVLRPDVGLAIDLGTARIRFFIPRTGIVLDEPNLVAYASTGEVIAAGHAAWSASAADNARLHKPVRSGVIRDPIGCVHALRLLLAKALPDRHHTDRATVCIPATAHLADVSVILGVAASATGGQVRPVASGLAACLGAGLDVARPTPRLVCDVGAGITEIACVAQGLVLASAALRSGIGHYDEHPDRAVRDITALLHRLLNQLSDRRHALAGGNESLLLVGGGALLADLAPRLSAALQLPVLVPERPRDVVAFGLGDLRFEGSGT